MLTLCTTSSFDDRAWLCTMTTEAAPSGAPVAYALVHDSAELRDAIAAAYDELAKGLPGDIEIPICVAIAPATMFDDVSSSIVPHVHALKAAVDILSFQMGDQTCRQANGKIATAFQGFVKPPRRPNARLVVSRDEAPRLRTAARSRREALSTRPLGVLEQPAWSRAALSSRIRHTTAEAA